MLQQAASSVSPTLNLYPHPVYLTAFFQRAGVHLKERMVVVVVVVVVSLSKVYLARTEHPAHQIVPPRVAALITSATDSTDDCELLFFFWFLGFFCFFFSC